MKINVILHLTFNNGRINVMNDILNKRDDGFWVRNYT